MSSWPSTTVVVVSFVSDVVAEVDVMVVTSVACVVEVGIFANTSPLLFSDSSAALLVVEVNVVEVFVFVEVTVSFSANVVVVVALVVDVKFPTSKS